jgi:hypothetical protein
MGVFSNEIPVCGVQYVGLIAPEPLFKRERLSYSDLKAKYETVV